jgi:tRNA threonylcarbamoyladenosine biosynthesis protein TsaB
MTHSLLITSYQLLTQKGMKLFIDTSDSEEIVVGVDEKMHKTKARQDKSQKLLPFIDDLLKKEGKQINDITDIEVNTGPGSFTGLRVGVSVAQALGWVLQVPVNGKDIASGETIDIKYD